MTVPVVFDQPEGDPAEWAVVIPMTKFGRLRHTIRTVADELRLLRKAQPGDSPHLNTLETMLRMALIRMGQGAEEAVDVEVGPDFVPCSACGSALDAEQEGAVWLRDFDGNPWCFGCARVVLAEQKQVACAHEWVRTPGSAFVHCRCGAVRDSGE